VSGFVRLFQATALAALLFVATGSVGIAADLLRVGKPNATGFEFAVLDVGIAKGIFARNGIEVEALLLPGSRNQQALVAHSTDIALGTGVELALMAKGSTARGVAAIAGPALNLGLLAVPGHIDSAAALKGKKIGVSSVSSLTAWLAREFARRQGWGPQGVQLVALGGADGTIGALLIGNVDAIVTSLVGGYKLEEQGRAKVLQTFGDIPDFLDHVIFASDELMTKRPDALRRFIRAWFETIAFMRQNRAETIVISRKTTGLSQALAERVYDEQMPMFFNSGHFPPAALETMKRSFIDLGLLDHVPDNSQLVTEAFLP
jgi:ABC-type nitrate/sulfonate/bicarbonate transport system substrate-binding protein